MASELPSWFVHLDDDDHQFLKRFVLASGSLKDLAVTYGVSYPTIRLRLDRLISRIADLDEKPPSDAFDARLRRLVADGHVPVGLGKELLRLHNSSLKGIRK